MRKYGLFIYTTLLFLLFVAISCTEKNHIGVSTNKITNIGITSVLGEASVVRTSDVICLDCGICWDTVANPSFEKNHKVESSGYGDFAFHIRDLSAQTKYYLRAYARSIDEIFYGNQLEFWTQPPFYPGVLTEDIVAITQNSAVCSGKVFNGSGASITERGFCWSSVKSNPTLDGGSGIFKTNSGEGTGSFTSNISGLEPNTTYYVRAYAINKVGAGYGQVKEFITIKPLLYFLQF